MASVVVVGNGSFARLARRYLDAGPTHEVVAFCVNRAFIAEAQCDGLPVVALEELEQHHPSADVEVLIGCGYRNVNRDRERLTREVLDRGYRVVTYVSPSAQVWPGTPIGQGCFLFESVTVQLGAQLGDGVIAWSGSTVCHDSVVEDYCFLASNVVVSGNVRLGRRTFAGANATFRDGVSTGPATVVGAGALITRDTAEGSVHSVRGTPARGDHSRDLGAL